MKFASKASLFVLPMLMLAVGAAAVAAEAAKKPLRAGMIGLDTSHVVEFVKILNSPKAEGDLADVKVVAGFPGGSPDLPDSWNRVKKFTETLRSREIEIVPSIDELLKKVDVVFLESVDGRPHLEQARPVIAAHKPLFIDKPMAGSLADVIVIFDLAKKAGVPVFSASSLRFAPEYQALRAGTSPMGKVQKCISYGPLHIEPHHPDLFYYGIHGVEGLYTILGTGCKTVTRSAPGTVRGDWADGREGSYIDKEIRAADIEGTKDKGTIQATDLYPPLVTEICKFFKTGRPPVAEEETIEIFAFMEAADVSKREGGKPVAIADVLAKARQTAAEKSK